MMRAVWSFWSAPFEAYQHAVWSNPRHHLLSWVLSVESARRHYVDTTLITDDPGAALLVDELRLPFGHVATSLNVLAERDAQWWALGKLHAYAAQSRPFVHIDSDVYLWKPLPESVVAGPVFCQNPEALEFGQGWYRPDRWDLALNAVHGWRPPEWSWYTFRRGSEAACCGVFGGCDTAFISYYARNAIRMIEHPRNQLAWRGLGSLVGDNVLAEQYLLSACVHYHADNPRSEFSRIEMRYLFDSIEEASTSSRAEQLGYTHLIAGAKRDPDLIRRLEQRVREEHPDCYARVLRYSRLQGWPE
jgi:hypothetical protein